MRCFKVLFAFGLACFTGPAQADDIFERLAPPDPARPHAIYSAADLDFRLNPSGKAVDAGVRLPNVNDGFAGCAPDLGALETGQPEPVYGPRGRTLRQF